MSAKSARKRRNSSDSRTAVPLTAAMIITIAATAETPPAITLHRATTAATIITAATITITIIITAVIPIPITGIRINRGLHGLFRDFTTYLTAWAGAGALTTRA